MIKVEGSLRIDFYTFADLKLIKTIYLNSYYDFIKKTLVMENQ